MSTSAVRLDNDTAFSRSLTLFEKIKLAQQVIQEEADALAKLAKHLPADFDRAVTLLCHCRGNVIVTGIGKAGWIAQKISASLASTGTRSHFLHPGEAMHGDLGRIGPDDVVMFLSNSGETAEILQLLEPLKALRVPMISIVGNSGSSLAKASDLVLHYGSVREACLLGLAPSTSTAVMLALGDALALVTSCVKGFKQTDFAKFHPGGNLGLKLSVVDQAMRPLEQCRLASQGDSIREIFVRLQRPQRRSGAILLTDANGKLTGIFTDSDLARLLERGQEQRLDNPILELMSREPKTVIQGTRTTVAVEILARHNISELPVVDAQGRPIGVVDITDVVGLLPRR